MERLLGLAARAKPRSKGGLKKEPPPTTKVVFRRWRFSSFALFFHTENTLFRIGTKFQTRENVMLAKHFFPHSGSVTSISVRWYFLFSSA